MNALFWALGVVLFLLWLFTYVSYRLMLMATLVLYSAGKMQTGNDLGEQMKQVKLDKKYPSYLKFYWDLYTKEKNECKDERKKGCCK